MTLLFTKLPECERVVKLPLQEKMLVEEMQADQRMFIWQLGCAHKLIGNDKLVIYADRPSGDYSGYKCIWKYLYMANEPPNTIQPQVFLELKWRGMVQGSSWKNKGNLKDLRAKLTPQGWEVWNILEKFFSETPTVSTPTVDLDPMDRFKFIME